MASICLVIKCTLNPSSISVLQYLSCIFFCFLLIFPFFFFFLFFAGECIPPRTTALAASTFNLYVSLASVDVNTFQVSCQPACSLPPQIFPPTLSRSSPSLCASQVDKRLNKSQSQPVENFIRLTWRFISSCFFFVGSQFCFCCLHLCSALEKFVAREIAWENWEKNPNNQSEREVREGGCEESCKKV